MHCCEIYTHRRAPTNDSGSISPGLHGARQPGGSGGRRQQVYVIGHQYIGVNGQPVGGRGRDQPIAVLGKIVIAEEDRLAVVAALDYMQRLIGNEIASEPRHANPR